MKENKWDKIIEEIILGYQRWWGKDIKERVQKLLFLSLKRKYKNNKPITKEELEFFKSKKLEKLIKSKTYEYFPKRKN